MTAPCIMILGTSSGAGKSWIATALCRYYANQGLKVAPFKAQNMSNNARVVPEKNTDAYCEIGAAQYFQAIAARAAPDVRMNPLLLKPETDTHSQVILMGRVNQKLTQMPWRERAPHVWETITQALDSLRQENDLIIIEGAGSPAEINLTDTDVVNMRIARYANARCLLTSDIDRGGAFAHLYGTWALLPEESKKLIHGYILNRFRGNPDLLAPAPEKLEQLTKIKTAAVIPLIQKHGLPEEDSLFDTSISYGAPSEDGQYKKITIINYPKISNLDEFTPLKNIKGIRLNWASKAQDIKETDLIILPGSKATLSDLAWLRAQKIDSAIAEHAQKGGRVLGICGGLQMLGEALIDIEGVESKDFGSAPGLGLLPLVTNFAREKKVIQTQIAFKKLNGAWQALSNIKTNGYEIHTGQTMPHSAMVAKGDVPIPVATNQENNYVAWQNTKGNVLGCYIHGLFENDNILKTLWGENNKSQDEIMNNLAEIIKSSFIENFLNNLIK